MEKKTAGKFFNIFQLESNLCYTIYFFLNLWSYKWFNILMGVASMSGDVQNELFCYLEMQTLGRTFLK